MIQEYKKLIFTYDFLPLKYTLTVLFLFVSVEYILKYNMK